MTKYTRRPSATVNETYKYFFDVLKLNSLEELVKTAVKVFGLPIVLHDENSRLLYQYPRKPLGEKMWDIFLKQKAADSDILHEYQAKLLSDKPADFEPFYYRPDDPDESSYILGQIFHNGKNYGYFTIFMFDSPFDATDIDRAKIFSEALGFIIYQRNSTSTISLNASLYDALAGEKGETARSHSISTLIKNTKGIYTLMVKPIGSKTSQKTYATMTVRRMPDLHSGIIMTIYNDCLVILYCNINSKNYITSEFKKFSSIEEFIRPAGDGCGISTIFDDLYNINLYYQQAYMTALCTKKKFEFYDNLAPSPIFQFAALYGNPEAFIHPVLNRISQYDALNKSDYFETLRIYSMLMHNKELSAAELCIHRNTLLYRLNRISEIFELPFEEPQTALHILNSFQLWDITKNKH